MANMASLAVYVGVAAAVAVVAALLRRTQSSLAIALAFAVNAFIIGTFPRLDSDPDTLQGVNYFSPAPYGFAIWGAIYATEFLFVIWQWFAREELFVKKWRSVFAPWWCAGHLFQVAWGLSFVSAFDTKALGWIPAVALTCVAASLSKAHGLTSHHGAQEKHTMLGYIGNQIEAHAKQGAKMELEKEVPQYTPGPLKVFLPLLGAIDTLALFMPCFPKQAAEKLRPVLKVLDDDAGHMFFLAPVALHFGWTTAASLVAWNLYLVTLEASTSLKLLAACVSVVLATVVGAQVTIRRKSALYGATVAWALVAVAQRTRTSTAFQAEVAGNSPTLLASLEYVSACGLLFAALLVKLKK